MMAIPPRTIVHKPLAEEDMRYLSAALLLLLLAGCMTRPLTEEQAARYANSPLVTFLDERFPYPNFPVVPPAVSYKAFFKKDSYHLLLNPVTDVQTYCRTQKGSLLYEGRPATSTIPYVSADAGVALDAAIDRRAFGQFVCRREPNKTVLWRVSIWPASVLRPTGESLGSFQAIIAIRPL
jgi:hypothetical protein